jgi:Domain of unknown function (DUF2828)
MNTILTAINKLFVAPAPTTTTENGAPAFETTGNKCLDLFFKLLRDTEPENVKEMFYDAWLENPKKALQILLHCRDCRKGKGERLIVLHALTWLRRHKPITYLKNLRAFLAVGYYQDLLNLVKHAEADGQEMLGGSDMIELELFVEQLRTDKEALEAIEPISLAAKWAPTECHKDDREYAFASRMAKLLFPSYTNSGTAHLKQYRQLLSKLRHALKVVETHMAHNRWSEIEYKTVPAKSHKLHTEAFKRHDPERYQEYLDAVKAKTATIKSTGLQPHELTNPFMSRERPENAETLQAQWDDLIDQLRKTSKLGCALPLCDVSASMNGEPMEVCIALGLVVTELVSGPFKDMIMTFETNPKLFMLKHKGLAERVQAVKHASWGGSTDLMAAFDQILSHAVMMQCTQDQLPKVLIIFSDMQFNEACSRSDQTVFQLAKDKFAAEGYELPSVVFWNLRSTHNSFPVSMNEQGVIMLSGYSAQLLRAVMDDPRNITPIQMLNAILEDYPQVVVEDSEVGPSKDDGKVVVYDHSAGKDKRKKKKRGTGPGSQRRGATKAGDDDDDDESDHDDNSSLSTDSS